MMRSLESGEPSPDSDIDDPENDCAAADRSEGEAQGGSSSEEEEISLVSGAPRGAVRGALVSPQHSEPVCDDAQTDVADSKFKTCFTFLPDESESPKGPSAAEISDVFAPTPPSSPTSPGAAMFRELFINQQEISETRAALVAELDAAEREMEADLRDLKEQEAAAKSRDMAQLEAWARQKELAMLEHEQEQQPEEAEPEAFNELITLCEEQLRKERERKKAERRRCRALNDPTSDSSSDNSISPISGVTNDSSSAGSPPPYSPPPNPFNLDENLQNRETETTPRTGPSYHVPSLTADWAGRRLLPSLREEGGSFRSTVRIARVEQLQNTTFPTLTRTATTLAA